MSNTKKTETKKVAYLVVGTISDAAKVLIEGLVADKTFEIVDLESIDQDLQKQLSVKDTAIEQLLKAGEDLGKLHGKNIAEKDKEIATLTGSVTRLTEELGTLSAELGSAQSAADQGFQTVKSGKKTYRIYGKKWRYEGRDITADDLKKDPALVASLVKIGVGFLVELNEKEG